MEKRINTTAGLLFLAFLILSNLSDYAQRTKYFKYPKTAFCIDLFGGYATVQQSDNASDYDSNISFRIIFEFAQI